MKKFQKKLCKKLQGTPVPRLLVSLTVGTCHPQQIKFLRKSEKNNALKLRILVEGGGCNGFLIKFDLDAKPVKKQDMCVVPRFNPRFPAVYIKFLVRSRLAALSSRRPARPDAEFSFVMTICSVFEKDGAEIVIDDVSMDFLKDCTVDFEEELSRSAFVVAENPNAKTNCGCKVSFGV
jgi:Fe-S cluster assembly iron-binding protein IscA